MFILHILSQRHNINSRGVIFSGYGECGGEREREGKKSTESGFNQFKIS